MPLRANSDSNAGFEGQEISLAWPFRHQGPVEEADGLLEFDRTIKSIESERIGERFNSEQFLQIAMVWRAVHEYLSLPGAPSHDYRPPWSKLLSYWKRSKSIPLVSGMHATMRLPLGEVSKSFAPVTYINSEPSSPRI